jgi:hypothetical protein
MADVAGAVVEPTPVGAPSSVSSALAASHQEYVSSGDPSFDEFDRKVMRAGEVIEEALDRFVDFIVSPRAGLRQRRSLNPRSSENSGWIHDERVEPSDQKVYQDRDEWDNGAPRGGSGGGLGDAARGIAGGAGGVGVRTPQIVYTAPSALMQPNIRRVIKHSEDVEEDVEEEESDSNQPSLVDEFFSLFFG